MPESNPKPLMGEAFESEARIPAGRGNLLAGMTVDPELLEILVCPKTKGDLELVELPEAVRKELVEKYQEHFRDEVPVVEQGLHCAESGLVYPIVSDIPIMLVEDALPADILAR